MSDPYDDVPVPLGSRMVGPMSIGCFFFLVPVVALLVAIFVLRWPWWGDVLAAVGALVLLAASARFYEDRQRDAWLRRHPKVMKKTPPQ